MAKAVYVLNRMPDNCAQCKFFDIGSDYCYLNVANNMDPRYRMKDCPLKELPEHRMLFSDDFSFEEGFIAGWNECLGVIEGTDKEG